MNRPILPAALDRNPVIAVLIGWVAGEMIDGWVLAGIATILLGVFLVRGGERPAEASEMPAVDFAAVEEPSHSAISG